MERCEFWGTKIRDVEKGFVSFGGGIHVVETRERLPKDVRLRQMGFIKNGDP